jgi:hypothetical protein
LALGMALLRLPIDYKWGEEAQVPSGIYLRFDEDLSESLHVTAGIELGARQVRRCS